MRLNPDRFARFLDGFAEPFTFRRSFSCPCLNPTSGSPSPKCPRCLGKGHLWDDPVPCTAAVASSNVQLKWSTMGMYETGDKVLSVPHTSRLYEVRQFDRVTALTDTDELSATMLRGGGRERLTGSIKQVDRVFWFDASSRTVEGSIPLVSATGGLSWPDGGAPPDGTPYSITYSRFIDYYCFGDYSTDRNKHGGLPLPRKVIMRRFDLFGRTPQPAAP